MTEVPGRLLRWQVKNLTRANESLDRLAAHPGGPLVAQGGVYASARSYRAGTITPLIVLADAGRAHLREHLADYRNVKSELPLP
ncbi:hypothetical protein [Amycolatopsis thailandensis]|uniref:hypothetical protein n=1 Tax=Amycolatopsis thailandensis TaxID=589330 RepID=UPI00364097F8